MRKQYGVFRGVIAYRGQLLRSNKVGKRVVVILENIEEIDARPINNLFKRHRPPRSASEARRRNAELAFECPIEGRLRLIADVSRDIRDAAAT